MSLFIFCFVGQLLILFKLFLSRFDCLLILLQLAPKSSLSLELLESGQLISVLDFVLDHLFFVFLPGQLGLGLVRLFL